MTSTSASTAPPLPPRSRQAVRFELQTEPPAAWLRYPQRDDRFDALAVSSLAELLHDPQLRSSLRQLRGCEDRLVTAASADPDVVRFANRLAVAVVGSREFCNRPQARRAVWASVWSLPAGSVVVSGRARGVDLAAEQAAWRDTDLGYDLYPADFGGEDGRAAGHVRNALLVARADAVVAFTDQDTPGTNGTLKLAARADVPTLIVSSAAVDRSEVGVQLHAWLREQLDTEPRQQRR